MPEASAGNSQFHQWHKGREERPLKGIGAALCLGWEEKKMLELRRHCTAADNGAPLS